MSKFWIKKLIVHGLNSDTELEFSNGLNIVHGPSNTGKTYILKCIDYCLGAKKAPFNPQGKYTDIELEIQTDDGLVIINRTFFKDKVLINSSNPNIESGEYPITSKPPKENLSTILIKLLGIYSKPKVIKNENFERIRLGLRTILHFFIIDETLIQSDRPILIPTQYTQKTSTISSLAYLITGDDRSEENTIESEKVIKVQKSTLIRYINSQKLNYQNELDNLTEEINQIKKPNGYTTAEEIVNDLAVVEQEITTVLSKGKSSSLEILELEEKINESNIILGQYNELSSQYFSDIKRLNFIIDGHDKYNETPHSNECPLCQSKVENQFDESYIETSRYELSNIVSILSGLKETYNSVLSIKKEYEKKLKQLIDERKKDLEFLNKELKPRANELKQQLNNFNKYHKLNTKVLMIVEIIKQLDTKLYELSLKDENKPEKYRNSDAFPEDFTRNMTNILTAIFRKCKFDEFRSVEFLSSNLDIKINGKPKRTFGKGYRSFSNSCLVIGLREYLNTFGSYSPGFLIIDSPITTFDSGVDDNTSDGMKYAFMMYLIHSQCAGQTIIIENKIPKINYKSYNVKLIEFTKGKKIGRYGFLTDMKNWIFIKKEHFQSNHKYFEMLFYLFLD